MVGLSCPEKDHPNVFLGSISGRLIVCFLSFGAVADRERGFPARPSCSEHERGRKAKDHDALTSIKGIGRRFANIVCKKADVDMNETAGELSAAELENLMMVVANPRQFKIPDWFLNRKKGYKDGRYSQIGY